MFALYFTILVLGIICLAYAVLALPGVYRNRQFRLLAQKYNLTYHPSKLSRFTLISKRGNDRALRGSIGGHAVEISDRRTRGWGFLHEDPLTETICLIDGQLHKLPRKRLFTSVVSVHKLGDLLHSLS